MANRAANDALEAAGFPAATRELMWIAPVEDLAGDDVDVMDLDVHVEGVDGQARMAVGYLPDGPVTAGQQLVKNGETRRLVRQFVKPGAFLVVTLDRPGDVDVRVAGAHSFDSDEEASFDGAKCFDGDEQFGADGVDVTLGELTLTPNAPSSSSSSSDVARATMDATLQQLDAMMAEARAKRSASTLIVNGENIDTALANDANMISILRGSAYQAVLAGERPLRSGDTDAPGWMEVAQGISDELVKKAGVMSRTDFGSIATQVAEHLSTAAAGAAAEVPNVTRYLAAAAIAVAVIVVVTKL